MDSNYILFFFSAIGVFNGILLGVYLVTRAKERKKNMVLGWLVLLCCIRAGISCVYFFDKDLPFAYVQIGMLANLFIGPILFIYLLQFTKSSKKKKYTYSLVIGMILAASLSIIYPFTAFPNFWDDQLRYVLHTVLTGFLLAAGYLLFNFWEDNRNSKGGWKPFLVYLSIVSFCMGFAISLYTSYILGPILASLVLYLALLFNHYLLRKTLAKKNSFETRAELNNAEKWSKKLREYLLSHQSFLQKDLTISDLAKQIGLSTSKLSQLLNDYLGQSFKQYLNAYRVDYAQNLLAQNQLYTIEAIGLESGFNSKSSFFATFKKMTGLTPRQFQQQHNDRTNQSVQKDDNWSPT